MNEAIGIVLPHALGVAISPLPIMAAILMLFSPNAKGTSLGFLFGWVAGVIVAVGVFTLIGSLITVSDDEGPAPVSGVVRLVLGALLLILAVNRWRKRPTAGEEPHLPKWMTAIDTMKPGSSLGLGFALAALNPKNLIMAAVVGVAISAADLSVGGQVIVGLIFVVIAVSTVAIPVIAYLLAAGKMAAPLEELRAWLVTNNTAVMSVLLLVLGVVNVGKGIGSF